MRGSARFGVLFAGWAVAILVLSCRLVSDEASYYIRNDSQSDLAVAEELNDGTLSFWIAAPAGLTVALGSQLVGGPVAALIVTDSDCNATFRLALEPGNHVIDAPTDASGSFTVSRVAPESLGSVIDSQATFRESCQHAFKGVWATNHSTRDVVVQILSGASQRQFLVGYYPAVGWIDTGVSAATNYVVFSTACELMATGPINGVVGIEIGADGDVSTTDRLPPAVVFGNGYSAPERMCGAQSNSRTGRP